MISMGTAFPETKNRSDPCQSQSLLQANESSNPCYHPHPGNSVNDDSAGEMPRVSRIAKKYPFRNLMIVILEFVRVVCCDRIWWHGDFSSQPRVDLLLFNSLWLAL
jgi:hypothetical protein